MSGRNTVNLREQANRVLATCHISRCERGYDENGFDNGEYFAPGSCEEGATHRITSPHEDQRYDYCEKCAREVHAGIEYNHRWSLRPIREVEGIIEARKLAEAVLATLHEVENFNRLMVTHSLAQHPFPWRVESDRVEALESALRGCR